MSRFRVTVEFFFGRRFLVLEVVGVEVIFDVINIRFYRSDFFRKVKEGIYFK